MFAIVKRSRGLSALSYNETKLTKGDAVCLLADNFIKDVDRLTYQDKIDRFRDRITLNDRAVGKSTHVVIGFFPHEKVSDENMKELGRRYMKAIGFEEQPYLIYRHLDTAQPHLHIVGLNIRPDGSQINIDRRCFFRVKREIRDWAHEFSLRPTERINPADEEKYRVQNAHIVMYGKEPIKRGISGVLHTVIDRYKYTNLEEFNSVLRLYNIIADRGRETSQRYQNKGLMYHVLDDTGKRVGIPLKASSFLLKPTLPNLEKRFALNQSFQQENRQRIMTAIDWTLAGTPPDWRDFTKQLEKKDISVVTMPQGRAGPQRIFFVDHESGLAIDGKTLGSQYVLETIRARCAETLNLKEQQKLHHRLKLSL